MKTKIVSVEFFRVHRMIDDMLRYDCAFASDKFPGIVAYPKFRSRNGDWGGKPTMARWQSFLAGFNPTPMMPAEIQEDGILTSFLAADGWYTIENNNYERVYLKDYRD